MKMMKSNTAVKPLAVLTSAAPSIAYLGTRSMGVEKIPDSDMVAISAELVKSFQGSLVLLVLLMSIINIYKPSKVVIFSLAIGGMALAASSLLQTVGMVFLTYGLGLVFNSMTLNKTIERNEKLKTKQMDDEVDKIIKEAGK